MLKALANVAPRHLLDSRLNPPDDLRAMAGDATPDDTALAAPRPVALPLTLHRR